MAGDRQQERSALRERALRESGMALVTATNREGIHLRRSMPPRRWPV
jgi:hypothetical protein